MVDYTIVPEGQSEDFKIFYYSLQSSEPKTIVIKIINNYTNFIEWSDEITIYPNVICYTQYVSDTKNRYVCFYDKNTMELVTFFGLKGRIDMKDKDYESFVKITIPRLTSGQKHNLCVVFDELISQRIYNNEFIAVEENDFVVDIGFNFGLFTLDALFNNPKKVIGFEPNQNVSQFFKDIIKDSRVEIYDFAVSDFDGYSVFYENDDTGMSKINSPSNEKTIRKYDVQVINFFKFIINKQIEKIDFLKIDCEGTEFEILESISDEYLTNNIKKLAIEYHDYPTSNKFLEMKNKLKRNGFEFEIRGVEHSPIGLLYAKKINRL